MPLDFTTNEVARFWAKVDQSGECWYWTGQVSADGYGKFKARERYYTASRVAYELTFGPFPADLFICHTCDMPPCVNPAHLRTGTRDEHVADKVAKGRTNGALIDLPALLARIRIRRHAPLADRFWMKVQKTDTCWLWTATTGTDGYGYIGTGGQFGGRAAAHRVSWELAHGPIPDGMFVCHTCDVRACVRPDHLFLGTNADNVADRQAKGRHGGRSGRKLNETDVQDIRRRASQGETQRSLASVFDVGREAISDIVLRKTWKHIN